MDAPPAEPHDGIDLAKCEKVEYEWREGKPGVKFSRDEIEGWTPVVRKRSTKRRGLLYAQNQHDENNESSDEELRITQVSRRVKYQVIDGVPGLRIQKGNTMSGVTWNPIAPTPIALRTRAKSTVK